MMTAKEQMEHDAEANITLSEYVRVLKRISESGIRNYNSLDKRTAKMVKALIEEGLVSSPIAGIASTLQVRTSIVITPSGAAALLQWSDYLKQSGYIYKIGEVFLRFLWILVGVICTVLPQLFGVDL